MSAQVYVKNRQTGKVHALGPLNGYVNTYGSGCGLRLRPYDPNHPVIPTVYTQASPRPYAPTFVEMGALEPVHDYAKELCHRCFRDLARPSTQENPQPRMKGQD